MHVQVPANPGQTIPATSSAAAPASPSDSDLPALLPIICQSTLAHYDVKNMWVVRDGGRRQAVGDFENEARVGMKEGKNWKGNMHVLEVITCFANPNSPCSYTTIKKYSNTTACCLAAYRHPSACLVYAL